MSIGRNSTFLDIYIQRDIDRGILTVVADNSAPAVSVGKSRKDMRLACAAHFRRVSVIYALIIRDREELTEQIKALKALKKLAEIYGFDISMPAETAQQAIQSLRARRISGV